MAKLAKEWFISSRGYNFQNGPWGSKSHLPLSSYVTVDKSVSLSDLTFFPEKNGHFVQLTLQGRSEEEM